MHSSANCTYSGNKVTIKGILFEPGMIINLGIEVDGFPKFARVTKVIKTVKEPAFRCHALVTEPNHHVHAYRILNENSGIIEIAYSELRNQLPVNEFICRGIKYACPKAATV